MIEKGREIWALAMRMETLGLVAVASERRKVDLAIDAIVEFLLSDCYVQRERKSSEQHNSNRRALSSDGGSPRFLGKGSS